MESPKRRKFLRMAGIAGTIGLTGCQRSFTGESTPSAEERDADGDGVINSKDPAPLDPEIKREETEADGGSTTTETQTDRAATPVLRLDDQLPNGFENGGAARQTTGVTIGASGDYAWRFDGESYIQTDYTWGENDHSGTFSSWVYVSPSDADISSPRYLVSVCDASPQVGEFDELSLLQYPDEGIGIRKNTDGTEANDAEAFASEYPTNQWFHLTGVVDKETNEVRVYVNGEQRDVGSDSEITIEHGTKFGIGAQAKTIGGTSYQYTGHFTGKLDDVRIYDTAVAPEHIPRV